MPVKDECVYCGKASEFICGRCHEPYCNVNCQTQDWRKHKRSCFQMPNLVALNSVLKHHRSKSGTPHLDERKPPQGIFIDVVVRGLATNAPNMFWVSEVQHAHMSAELEKQLKNSAHRFVPLKPADIVVGTIVVIVQENAFYRAKVLRIDMANQKALVQLIDYGSKVTVSMQALLKPIPEILNMEVFTFAVRLVNVTSPAINVKSTMSVKILSYSEGDGCYTAEQKMLKDSSTFLPVDILRKSPDVNLHKVFNLGRNALFELNSTPFDNSELNSLISKNANDFNFEKIPLDNTLVVAVIEKVWQRAILLGFYKEKEIFLVFLVDCGRIAFCEDIKRIPEEFATVPMALVCAYLPESENPLDFKISKAHKYILKMLKTNMDSAIDRADVACALLNESGQEILKVRICCFVLFIKKFDFRHWYEQIDDGTTVYITKVVNNTQIYISSTLLEEYTSIFSAFFDRSAAYSVSDCPNIKDFVLVKTKEGDQGVFRGEILSVSEDGQVSVRNADTCIIATAKIHNLRKANSLVSSLPVYLQKVTLSLWDEMPGIVPNNEAWHVLEQCVLKGSTFFVQFTDRTAMKVELFIRNEVNNRKESLAKNLLPLLFRERKSKEHEPKIISSTDTMSKACSSTPIKNGSPAQKENRQNSDHKAELVNSSVTRKEPNEDKISNVHTKQTSDSFTEIPKNIQDKQKNSSLQHQPRGSHDHGAPNKIYMYRDLEVHKLPLGDTTDLFVLDPSGFKHGYLTAFQHNHNDFVNNMESQSEKLNQYGKKQHSITKQGYEPRVDEICVALFPDDNAWYRAVCIDVVDALFRVVFIDYGNCVKLTKKNILPITKEFLTPIYAHKCFIKDLTSEQASQYQYAIEEDLRVTCKIVEEKQEKISTYIIELLPVTKQ